MGFQLPLFSSITIPGSITKQPIPQQEQDLAPVFGKEIFSGELDTCPYRFTDWYGRYGKLKDYTVQVYGYIDDSIVLGKVLETGRVDEFGVFSLFPVNQ